MAQTDIETCIDWCEPGWAFFSSNERKWISKIHKLKQQRPDEVVIMREPEQNNGVIYAKFPQKWTRIVPAREIYLDEEKRRVLAEMGRIGRQIQAKKKQEEQNQ